MRRMKPHSGVLRGVARVPGDKSISHRVALMAPLTSGRCRARGWLRSADTRASLEAVGRLGAEYTLREDELLIESGGFPTRGPCISGSEKVHLDCGNSGTTARLLVGLLAGRSVLVELDGDLSLRSRPMGRVVDPLRKMGARINYCRDEGHLPLEIHGVSLEGGECRLSKPSAQIKSALLLANLSANRGIRLTDCGASRDHTELMLAAMGAEIATGPEDGGFTVLQPGQVLEPFDVRIPGDPSSAVFPIAAALLLPGSEVLVPDVCLNPTRTGFLRVLKIMGADIRVEKRSGAAGEARGDILVKSSRLLAFEIDADDIPALIDELPILAVLAARAEGISRIRGAAELRVKESDRIASTAAGLRALGVEVEEYPDGLDIVGRPDWGRPNHIVRIKTCGDHRLAMSFAVASLVVRGEVELDDDACVGISFPGFFDNLDTLKE